MRFVRTNVAVFLSVVLAIPVFGQQAAAPSPSPRALLQRSIAAMGTNLPSDSTATGSVTLVAGSRTDQGTVRILTRGTNQTSIQFQTTSASWSVIYSSGQANRVDSTGTTELPLELVASSQSPYFPLPFLSGFLSNPDVSLQFLGQETLDSSPANHIRAQNTFQSATQMQFLADFTATDIWLDATSGLPLRVSFVRRYGGGDSPRIPITISFSNYQVVSGVKYPFTIQESINGTLWATTTIQTAVFNTALTDANFPVTREAN